MDKDLQGFGAGIIKMALKVPAPSQLSDLAQTTMKFGKNVGREAGLSSSKAGFSTSYKSFGVKNMASEAQRKMPTLPGMKPMEGSMHTKLPPAKASSDNQFTLRRGLSNIQTPEPT